MYPIYFSLLLLMFIVRESPFICSNNGLIKSPIPLWLLFHPNTCQLPLTSQLKKAFHEPKPCPRWDFWLAWSCQPCACSSHYEVKSSKYFFCCCTHLQPPALKGLYPALLQWSLNPLGKQCDTDVSIRAVQATDSNSLHIDQSLY